MTRNNIRQQNAERRLRHARWDTDGTPIPMREILAVLGIVMAVVLWGLAR